MTKRAYAVVTIPRPKDYLGQTLKSLERSGFFDQPENLPLHLIAACPDDSHLAPYVDDPRFEVHRLTPDEAAVWATLGTKPRCAFGHYITMGRMLEREWDELLVFEDDVKVARGWMEYLEKVIPDVRATALPDKWVLSLYSFTAPRLRMAFMTGKRFLPVPLHKFWGTQGNVYPRSVVVGYRLYLLDICIRQQREAVDVALIWFGNDHDLAFFTLVPSVVEHMGDMTTGQSDHFHRAIAFFDPVREPLQPRTSGAPAAPPRGPSP